MPEILEIEYYRRAAEAVVGRVVTEVIAPDPWYCKGETEPSVLEAVLPGAEVTGVGRHGKLLLVETSDVVIGLRFGMTGRLIVDGLAPIAELEYSSDRDDPAWDRIVLVFDGQGDLRIRDPRRLGGVELDPDLGRLGPDAWEIGGAALASVLGSSTQTIKARLLDQARIAGLGNLLVDEILWRSNLDPARSAASLDTESTTRLHAEIGATLDDLGRRGGSHTGDLFVHRHRDGLCPRDGQALRRRRIGGRTTYDCPAHQR